MSRIRTSATPNQVRELSSRQRRIAMLFFQEGFSYRNFLLDALTIFFLIVWFWLLITVASDLFRRHDVSGWVKASWVIGWIIFPFFFVLLYLIFQGRGMAERNAQQAQQARDELRSMVGFSVADEIEKLGRLKKSGSDQRCRICKAARSACAVILLNCFRYPCRVELA
jgi:hypothetical protein